MSMQSMATVGGRRPVSKPAASPEGISSPAPAPEQGQAAGQVNERSSGTGASTVTPVPGTAPFDRRVIGIGGIVFAVLMALSARYGFHGDELYFMAGAQH